MKRIVLISLAALSLAACTTPTLYGPATGSQTSGFSEYRIQDNRYRVTFQGGGGAPSAQVEDYALLRAAELTLRDGYDWFRVVARQGESSGGSSPRMSVGVGGSNYGGYGYGGGSSVGVGLGTSFDLSGGPRMAVTLEVLLGRGERPQEAYDPRQIIRSIGEGRPPGPLPVAQARGGASI
jgi:hypothetical protein